MSTEDTQAPTKEGNGPACNPYEGMTETEKDAYVERSAPNDTENAEASPKSPVGPVMLREGVRVLANGTLFDTERKRFLPGGKPTSAIATSAQGSAMATRRHELAAIASRKALAEQAEQRGAQRSSVAAVGLLAGKAYAAAHDGFDGDKVENADGSVYYRVDRRGSVEAGKFALRLAHMLPEADKQQNIAVGVQVILSPEGAVSASRQVLDAGHATYAAEEGDNG